MGKNFLRPPKVFFVSSYPPLRCGIASFTCDLGSAVSELQEKTPGQNKNLPVVALTDVPEGYHYPQEVTFEINDQQRPDYREAADFLNFSGAEVVCLQHEFGIFGGESGVYILDLLRGLKKPVVTTLHWVLKHPPPKGTMIL